MYNLLKVELYKLKRDKNLLIIGVLIIVFGTINIAFQPDKNGKLSFISEFKDIFALLGCALYAGISIGSEFTNRTIQKKIVMGYSRIEIVFSKLISYFIGCIVLFLLSGIMFGGVYTLFYGWGQALTVHELFFIVNYTLIGIILNLCICSISFFISFFIKDTGISTAISICIVGFIISFSQNAWTYVAYCLASNTKIDFQSALITILFCLITLIAMLSVTCISFKKSELK